MNYLWMKRKAVLIASYGFMVMQVDCELGMGIIVSSITVDSVPMICAVVSSSEIETVMSVLNSLPLVTEAGFNATVETVCNLLTSMGLQVSEEYTFDSKVVVSLYGTPLIQANENYGFSCETSCFIANRSNAISNAVFKFNVSSVVPSGEELPIVLQIAMIVSEVVESILADSMIFITADSSTASIETVAVSRDSILAITENLFGLDSPTIITVYSVTKTLIAVTFNTEENISVLLSRYLLLSDHDSSTLSSNDSRTINQMAYYGL